ncbi:MAG: hypothetical protein ACI9JL_000487, partial [Paracoccaceae bacterium]
PLLTGPFTENVLLDVKIRPFEGTVVQFNRAAVFNMRNVRHGSLTDLTRSAICRPLIT